MDHFLDTLISGRRGGAGAEDGQRRCPASWTRRRGPLPQTRFVLPVGLNWATKLLWVVNKVDKPDARPMKGGGRVS